ADAVADPEPRPRAAAWLRRYSSRRRARARSTPRDPCTRRNTDLQCYRRGQAGAATSTQHGWRGPDSGGLAGHDSVACGRAPHLESVVCAVGACVGSETGTGAIRSGWWIIVVAELADGNCAVSVAGRRPGADLLRGALVRDTSPPRPRSLDRRVVE